jgi:DnaJ-class molecular chaperone
MRLSGHGLPDMKDHKKGDLYVRVQIKIPQHLNEEQKKIVEKLADVGL